MPNRYDDVMHTLGARYVSADKGLQPVSLSEEQLAELESELGHPLPEDYREFLRDYGDFRVSDAMFPVKKKLDYRTSAGVDVFFGATVVASLYIEDREHYLPPGGPVPLDHYLGLSLVRSVEEGEVEAEWPSELIPIGMDAAGSFVCLAIAGIRRGAVFFWYKGPARGDQGVYLVADSFDEFIRSVHHG